MKFGLEFLYSLYPSRLFGRETAFRNFNLSDTQFAPFVLYRKGAVDSLVRGLTRQNSMRFDRFFTDEVSHDKMKTMRSLWNTLKS